MTTSESKGRFFLQNESIRIDSYNESNRFESRIGMLYFRLYGSECANVHVVNKLLSHQRVASASQLGTADYGAGGKF